jgi:hypothetical protein
VLVLTLSFAQLPNAYSTEPTAPEKAIAFLTDVAGLDMAKYVVTLVYDIVEYPSSLGGLAEESVKYALESNESKIDANYIFRNDTLSYCHLTVLKGSLLYAQPPSENVLDTAKNIFQRYQNYSGTTDRQTMLNMLNTVTEMNTVKTAGNVKLEASGNSESASFKWFYTSNGIDFTRKGMHLKFENGAFTYFFDTWNLYTIGSDSLNVSEEEAISIARETVPKNYSYQVTLWNGTVVDVTGVNVVDEPIRAELLIGAKEPLTLHPYWVVHLYFDKVYLSNFYGWEVSIWADTGEVMGTQPKLFMGDPPSGDDSAVPPADSEPSTSAPEDSPSTSPSDETPLQPEATPTPPAQTENNPQPPTTMYIAVAAAAATIAIVAIALKKKRK